MAGQGTFEDRPPYRLLLSALYAMADLNPPPLFTPTNEETNVAEARSIIITHGGTPSSEVHLEIVSPYVHVRADPDPGSGTNSTGPPPPDCEPEKLVQPRVSPSVGDWALILCLKPRDVNTGDSDPGPANVNPVENEQAKTVWS